MNSLTDQQLLRDYTGRRSEAAFTELVRRHVDFVYSAALRMVRDAHLAEDVTQSVFAAFAQNARSLANRPVLSGWLHRTTQNLAANTVRSEVRRRAREQESAAMNELLSAEPGAVWESIATHLDNTLGELSEPDRDALLLRYFERKSARDMAQTLGVSEEAAQKRVNRAVERLRELFAKRGLTVGASGLAAVVSANAVQAAPVGLAATISTAAALTGSTLAAAAAATATVTRAIAMPTLQKILITATLGTVVGAGLYEARENSRLREQVRTLQEQQSSVARQRPPVEKPPETTMAMEKPARPSPPDVAAEWAARLLALNSADWRQAFATGQQLAALPPNAGFNILQANWSSITNVSARQQLLKAFDFAQHERLPAVIELAALDSSTDVQTWALLYLKEVALQDFSTNYAAGLDWLAAHRNTALPVAFADGAKQAADVLRHSDEDPVRAELALLKDAGRLFSQYPDAISATGLDQTLGQLADGSDDPIAKLALETASQMSLGDDWLREFALPRSTATNSWAVREAAASALGGSGREWALPALLDTLSAGVNSTAPVLIFNVAHGIAEVGSPKAIPTMIALIEAENTYDTIYGIGYFGLSKMTGVSYDEKHDGAWWRQWWNDNKQHFPADVQALEIPHFDPVKKTSTSAPVGTQPP